MHEFHKLKISIPAIRIERWILILIFTSTFILIVLISGDIRKLVVLASLPSCALFVLCAVHNPKRVFWGCFFVMPFIPYDWGIGITPLLPNMAPHRFLFFLIWLTYLLHRRKNRNKHELSLNVMDMLLIFLFIWLGISMFIANPIQGAYFRWPTRGLTIFLLFLVGKEMIRTSDDLWTVITIFAAQGLIMGVIGIIEALSQFNLWVLLSPFLTPDWKEARVDYHSQIYYGEVLRLKGTFLDPIPYGQYLAFLLPFCIGIMLRKKILGFIAFFSALTSLIFTQTRCGYLAAIASLVVFMFFAKRKIAVKVLMVVILASTIIVFFFSTYFSTYLKDTYERRILGTVHSDGVFHSMLLRRLNSPGKILKTTMKESPLFGFGPYTGDKAFHYVFSTDRKIMISTSFAMIAIQHGIPYTLGFEIYFIGIMVFMVYLIKHYRREEDMNKYGIFLIFLTAFAASFVILNIGTARETLPTIIIVFAGVQSVYYHERHMLKSRDNRQVVNVRR